MRSAGAFLDSVDVLGPAEVSLLLPTPLWPDSEGESLLLCSAGRQGQKWLLLHVTAGLRGNTRARYCSVRMQTLRALK